MGTKASKAPRERGSSGKQQSGASKRKKRSQGEEQLHTATTTTPPPTSSGATNKSSSTNAAGSNRSVNEATAGGSKGRGTLWSRATKAGKPRKQGSGPVDSDVTPHIALSGRTPSNINLEINKAARNATFDDRSKVAFFEPPAGFTCRAMSPDEVKAVFESAMHASHIMQQCRPELITELFKHVVPVFVKEGDLLFEQGKPGQIMWVVISAELQIEHEGRVGRRECSVLKRGQATTELDLLSNIAHEYTGVAR